VHMQSQRLVGLLAPHPLGIFMIIFIRLIFQSLTIKTLQ
jgi:hypothetical protein